MINKLIKHAESKGIAVYTNYTDGPSMAIFRFDKGKYQISAIALSYHRNKKLIVYDMLHELGHIDIRKNYKKYKTKYPAYAHAESQFVTKGISKYKRRTNSVVDTVREEYDAWDKGLEIAKKLGLRISVKDYRRHSVRSIITYLKYYGHQLGCVRSSKLSS
jgi:hypothetical protein